MSFKTIVEEILKNVKTEADFSSRDDKLKYVFNDKLTPENNINDGYIGKKVSIDPNYAIHGLANHSQMWPSREGLYLGLTSNGEAHKIRMQSGDIIYIPKAEEGIIETVPNADDNYLYKSQKIDEKAFKEYGNYPDNYNWRNNPYETTDSDEDEDYQNMLDNSLYKYFAIKALSDENGQPINPKYGTCYIGKEDGTENDLTINNVLSSATYDANVFSSQDEALAVANRFKQLNPNSKFKIVNVYSFDTTKEDEWYATPEEAYSYEKYKEDAYWGESTNSLFREKCLTILDQNNVKTETWHFPNKPDRAAKDSEVDFNKDYAHVDEMLTYALHGINPNVAYHTHAYWRNDSNNKLPRIFRIVGIDKKHREKGLPPSENTYIYIRPFGIIESENGTYRRGPIGDVQATTVGEILPIIKSDLNAKNYASVMRGESEHPSDWVAEIEASNSTRKRSFDEWYAQNKDILDLDGFNKFSIQRIYQAITKQGYSPKEAIARFEAERKKEESIDLTEVDKNDIITDPAQVKELLEKIGINPIFTDLPFVRSYKDLGDDTEPPVKLVIKGIPRVPFEKIRSLYVKDWDNGGRLQELDLLTIRNELNKEINRDPIPDEWDLFSAPDKINRALKTGNSSKFRELTKDEVIAALRYMEQSNNPKYKGIDLVGKFLAPQSYLRRNPLVLQALKDIDPEANVKAIRKLNSFNEISYQVALPNPDLGTLPPPRISSPNPYKKLKKTW